ncbi:MAG: hypothetical protein GC201_06460 [Alphaproteobacteria bacterium]|nr:hypothetical protein [Alphaproteobacteria bacterium]
MRADRPTADELLEAVEEFLREKVMPAVSGHLNFHSRVAANVIAAVRREVARSPEIEQAQHARLAGLLGHDGDPRALNRELCEQIRNGGRDLDDAALLEHLRLVALENLGVDNPRYSAYAKLNGE